ncbi:MAG TPA: class I SAM-dependent methyltransferase [Gemmataceae bacterium]
MGSWGEIAAEYREFRPGYPADLFASLAALPANRRLAWDCGTGNGQAARGLAAHFDRVVATDASPQQLQQALPSRNVEYLVAPAESCPLPDDCADLVVVAQALHWFDLDRFYAEVHRVGRPGSILAATCYYEPSVNPAVDAVLARYQETVRSYWPAGREWVDAGYRTIPFPFEELPMDRRQLSLDTDLPRFLGYLNTWSASRAFKKATGRDPLEPFSAAFADAWGAPTRTVTWHFNVRLGKIRPA